MNKRIIRGPKTHTYRVTDIDEREPCNECGRKCQPHISGMCKTCRDEIMADIIYEQQREAQQGGAL